MYNSFEPVYIKFIPQEIENGKLYISKEFGCAIHLCACGCGQKAVTPFRKPDDWQLLENDGKVSLTPSIGNFNGENPYHAHYYITANEVRWC